MATDLAGEQRPLTWVARESDSTLTVALSGELDIAVVPDCADGLSEPLAGTSRSIVFDLTDVTFADTTALRFLIDTKMKAESAGKRVYVSGVSTAVIRLFETAGMTSWFDYLPTNGDSVTP